MGTSKSAAEMTRLSRFHMNRMADEEQDPLLREGIRYPGKHDVMLGRGGESTYHCGNIAFRKLVEDHKTKYYTAPRANKSRVVAEVVAKWRSLDPPGRFLTRTQPGAGDESTWHDVGDRQALKKTSHSLRDAVRCFSIEKKQQQRELEEKLQKEVTGNAAAVATTASSKTEAPESLTGDAFGTRKRELHRASSVLQELFAGSNGNGTAAKSGSDSLHPLPNLKNQLFIGAFDDRAAKKRRVLPEECHTDLGQVIGATLQGGLPAFVGSSGLGVFDDDQFFQDTTTIQLLDRPYAGTYKEPSSASKDKNKSAENTPVATKLCRPLVGPMRTDGDFSFAIDSSSNRPESPSCESVGWFCPETKDLPVLNAPSYMLPTAAVLVADMTPSEETLKSAPQLPTKVDEDEEDNLSAGWFSEGEDDATVASLNGSSFTSPTTLVRPTPDRSYLMSSALFLQGAGDM